MRKILTNGGKLVCLLFFLNIQSVFAQQSPGTDPNQDIPIDGGASLLAAAGVAYGVKKYRDYKKGSAEDADEVE